MLNNKKIILILVALMICSINSLRAGERVITRETLQTQGFICKTIASIDRETRDYYFNKYGKEYNKIEVFVNIESKYTYIISYYDGSKTVITKI